MPAWAEDEKPPIVIGVPPAAVGGPGQPNAASSAPAGTHERCVDVIIGGEQSFGCLNEQLKRKVDQVNPVQNIAPIDAKSSDLKVGVVNIPGVQQQFGQNFGVSAFPFRPPALTFAPPTGRR